MIKKTTNPEQTELTPEEIDRLVLTEYPFPIAVNYRKMLEEEDWEKRVTKCIRVFEYGVRAITLGVLSQYLIRDRDEVSDPELNRELHKKKLSEISLGTWINYLFLALTAYGGKRNLFFMRELYDLYWDTSHTPHQPRKGLRAPFDRLAQIRNDLAHGREPKNGKDWEKLGREVLDNLRKFMGYFRFLQNYDLIRVVNPVIDEYEYERFTGQDITYHQEHLKSFKKGEKIQSGWFYLSRQGNTILRLHPLLIFWTRSEVENRIEGAQSDEQDVAVFDQLLKDMVGYIATVVGGFIEERDATLVAELRDLIYYNLEKIKMAPKRVKLSWLTARNAIHEISSDEMKGARKKYEQALYLQRETIYKKFQDFLSSDKTCFVLTGKSGVGKSNFVLSIADAFAANQHVAVLIYNGARLDVSSSGVVEKISQDLGKLMNLQGDAGANIFAELENNIDMTDKQMLVIFDAINENSDPRIVLKKIDQMVGLEHHPYPWLKILITSRPEGWRTMKRGLPLAEDRYYKEKGSDEVSVELEEFTIKLEIFERDELQAVYKNYRKFFDLKTEYGSLKAAVRNALRDPLVLRLVADIYKGRSIPEHIQVNDIYKLYVGNLIATGRLQREDIIFLEEELMPLMLKPGVYENKLMASQIQPAKTKDGRALWELIHNADFLGSGQKVNAAYMRLRDTELLDESGTGLEYVITFKYERFYEFFGGRRLHQAAKEQADLLNFYFNVAGYLNTRIFLWGALVQALVLELNDGHLDLLKGLSEQTTDNRLLRSALVEALVRFGETDKDKAKKFIEELIGKLTPPPKNFFEELARLRRSLQPTQEDAQQAQPQKMIVVEAAMRLRLSDLLKNLAVEPSPWLRNLAAQNIFYLWKQDHEAGMKILDSLSYRVLGQHGLPDMGAVESMLALIGAILGFEHKDPATLGSLSTIGRRALRRALYLTDLDQKPTVFTRIRKAFLGIVYNLVTGVVFKFALGTLQSWGEHAWASPKAMANFFKLSPEKKQLMRTMIPFVDYEEPGFGKRVEDIKTILEWGDQLSQAIVEYAILGNGVQDFDGTLDISRQLVEYGLSFAPPRFWTGGSLWNLWQSATHLDNPNPDKFMELMNRVTRAVQDDPALWLEHARRNRAVPLTVDTRASNIGNHMGAYYVLTKRAEIPEVIQTYLDRAIQANDDEYLKAYIQDFVAIFEMGYHHIAITGIKPLANYKNADIEEALIDFLVRARNYDPEYIEDLLLRGEFSQEIADRVLANPTSERLTDLLTYQLITVVYDLFILGPKPLRNELKWLFSKALELSSFQDFVVLIIREIFNLVVGEAVFSVPKDAPSRQLSKRASSTNNTLRP